MTETTWKICSICKRPITFETRYFACSVSTCNRKRIGLFFCSMACWDAHLPEARHRDAWAEQRTAPSHAEWQKEREDEERDASKERASDEEAARPQRRIVTNPTNDPGLPREVLVVVSKLKAYVKTR